MKNLYLKSLSEQTRPRNSILQFKSNIFKITHTQLSHIFFKFLNFYKNKTILIIDLFCCLIEIRYLKQFFLKFQVFYEIKITDKIKTE